MKEGTKVSTTSIGQLARSARVKIATVRFYERQGLLPASGRSAAGYREYSPEDLTRLVFIRRAKELGFTLAEIRDLLDLFGDPDTGCADVKARADEKLRDIEARIQDLRRVKRSLQDLARACRGEGPATACPILSALDRSRAEEP